MYPALQRSPQAVSRLFTGWHVAMYVADFSRCYGAVHADQPPFNDHPYRCGPDSIGT